jgi:hypothetical protein
VGRGRCAEEEDAIGSTGGSRASARGRATSSCPCSRDGSRGTLAASSGEPQSPPDSRWRCGRLCLTGGISYAANAVQGGTTAVAALVTGPSNSDKPPKPDNPGQSNKPEQSNTGTGNNGNGNGNGNGATARCRRSEFESTESRSRARRQKRRSRSATSQRQPRQPPDNHDWRERCGRAFRGAPRRLARGVR